MKNIWAITKRELGAYFASPVAYAIIAAFLVFSNALFMLYLQQREASLRGWVGTTTFLAIFFGPAITMRLLSEEKQLGTIELLLTSPVRDWEVILGKFFAALGFWVALLLLTLVYVVILRIFGNPDMVLVAAYYLALVLFGAAALSIGVLTSTLSSNQNVAVFTAIAIMLVLWIASFLTQLIPGGSGNAIASIIAYLSIADHTNDMVKGVIDSKDLIYYLSVTIGCLFLSTRALEARKWG
ncbi:MAG: ABC transporter permease [Chloroflexi bacterium]|nr:ABC transporter permease [Chloroflexota bacterium]